MWMPAAATETGIRILGDGGLNPRLAAYESLGFA
jgi:hypothetical protein